jgi:hypothetical protein
MSLSVGAALAQTFATATTTVTPERSDTYGLFGYSGVIIGTLVAIVIGLITFVGLICHMAPTRDQRAYISTIHLPPVVTLIAVGATIAINVIATLLVLTWWTTANWTDWNYGAGVCVAIGTIAIALCLTKGSSAVYERLVY